jgi:isopentenyldiphosphate isomerase
MQSAPHRRVLLLLLSILLVLLLQLAWEILTGGSAHPSEPPIEIFACDLSASRSLRTFESAVGLPRLADIPPTALRSLEQLVPISEAHRRGLLHRAIWLFVLDPHGRTLVLRRSRWTVTCPDTEGLVGEHSAPGESWTDTASRALVEELGLAAASAARIEVSMLGPPLLFRTDYAVDGGLLASHARTPGRDFQATALLAAELTNEQVRSIEFDRDVSGSRWATPSSLARQIKTERGAEPTRRGQPQQSLQPSPGSNVTAAPSAFCNRRTRALLELALRRLQRLRPKGGERLG